MGSNLEARLYSTGEDRKGHIHLLEVWENTYSFELYVKSSLDDTGEELSIGVLKEKVSLLEIKGFKRV